MLDSLQQFGYDRAYELLRAKRAYCPECGVLLNLPTKFPGEAEMIVCHHCSWRGEALSLLDFLGNEKELRDQPEGSKIQRRDEADGSVAWLMPASNRANALLVLGIGWSSFVGYLVYAMHHTGELPDSALPFAIPIAGIGLVLACFGVRKMLMESLIVLSNQEICLIQRVFGRVKRKQLDREAELKVERYLAYASNNRPVFGVRVYDSNGSDLKFGVRLRKDEVSWMVSQLKSALARQSTQVASKKPVVDKRSTTVPQEKLSFPKGIDTRDLTLRNLGDGGFSISSKEKLAGMFLWVALILAVMVSLVYFASDLGMEDADSMSPIVASIFYSASFLCLIVGFIRLGRRYYFEFSGATVKSSRSKFGRSYGVREFSKSDFHNCSITHCGRVNKESRYRVMLEGANRSLMLAHFETFEHATEIESRVLEWMTR
ncbi:hypothetical protein [Rubritalea marina]|uniref:hypothetical protein n=1 Tax=Rubritalea marina TaxID=361055 RepID=UPI000371FEE1|nr:hypothetical protein [Rubritalea marina]